MYCVPKSISGAESDSAAACPYAVICTSRVPISQFCWIAPSFVDVFDAVSPIVMWQTPPGASRKLLPASVQSLVFSAKV